MTKKLSSNLAGLWGSSLRFIPFNISVAKQHGLRSPGIPNRSKGINLSGARPDFLLALESLIKSTFRMCMLYRVCFVGKQQPIDVCLCF